MKKFIISALGIIALTSATICVAHNSDKGKWTCENNASSSYTKNQNDKNDQNNDNKNKGMSANRAFSDSYKHCGDCDKITCTLNK